MTSLQESKLISGEELQSRLDTVRALRENELEAYFIVKDRETGEHYLHYAYLHRAVQSGGAEQLYHQFMPIDHDEVLGYMFSEEPYTYPEHWRKAFLRNGPEGSYVWYDPVHLNEEDREEQYGKQLKEKLLSFKQKGRIDEESVRKLLKELEDLK